MAEATDIPASIKVLSHSTSSDPAHSSMLYSASQLLLFNITNYTRLSCLQKRHWHILPLNQSTREAKLIWGPWKGRFHIFYMDTTLWRECLYGIIAKVLDFSHKVSKFKHQSSYYIHFWTNAPRERYDPHHHHLLPQLWVK